MFRTVTALTLGIAVLAPGAARGQTQWEDQVQGQLTRAGRFFSENGFQMTHDVYTGSLDEEQTETLTLTLHAGTAYALVAVCDDDCSDLDLRLYDADGKLVDEDLKKDDAPIVMVTPDETASYTLKVIMAACSSSPCFYGVGAFGK